MSDAAMVQEEARVAIRPRNGGSEPTSPLQRLQISPVPIKIAKELLVREHYLHSLPGGAMPAFGVFLDGRLFGALTLGAGSFNSHLLVAGAVAIDCLTLTRLWLSDHLRIVNQECWES